MDAAARRTGLLIALVGLLIVIDTVMTVIALPTIVADLGTTLPRGAWMTTGYVLGLIVVIPLAGFSPWLFVSSTCRALSAAPNVNVSMRPAWFWSPLVAPPSFWRARASANPAV